MPDTDGTTTDTSEATAQATTRRGRRGRRGRTPEEQEAFRQQMREVVPWDIPMSRGDKVLVFSTLGVLAVMLLSMPLRPFLIASHPVALAAVTGSLSAIGTGAAFARIGDVSLWLVIVSGVVGMIKFDWLFWLAGRRWGPKVLEFFAPGEVGRRFIKRVQNWPGWALPLVVVMAALPGVPAAAVFALAGLGKMRLWTFLLFDAIGAALIVGLVVGLGYVLGQHAVDFVLMIDNYATWVSVAVIVGLAMISGRKQQARKARENTGA